MSTAITPPVVGAPLARRNAAAGKPLGRPSPSVGAGKRTIRYGGNIYVRVRRGESLISIAKMFGKGPLQAATLARINNLGRSAPRAESWILVPSTWVFPERILRHRRRALKLNNGRRVQRQPRALMGTDGGALAGDCPDGALPVYDDDGNLMECIPDPDWPQPEDIPADDWGDPCGSVGYDGVHYTGYKDELGDCIQCPQGQLYNYGAEECQDFKPTSGGGGESYKMTGCGTEVTPGKWTGAVQSNGECLAVDSSLTWKGSGLLFDVASQQVVQYSDGKKTGGGTITTGGNNKGNGVDTTGGGNEKTGGGTEDKGGGLLAKAAAFIKKPVVIGTAIAGSVVVAAVAAKKYKKRGG